MKPVYIGVTGVKDETTAAYLHSLERKCGIYISQNILCCSGNIQEPHIAGNQNPGAHGLGRVIRAAGLSSVHYHCCSDTRVASGDLGSDILMSEIDQMLSFAGVNPNIIQLNNAWPSPNIFSRIKSYGINVVLQCPKETLTDFYSFEQKISAYADVGIDYCLIDPSGGVGNELTVETAAQVKKYLSLAEKHLPTTRAGFAGGLCAANVAELYRYMDGKYFVCAQGKLKTHKTLDAHKAHDFIFATADVMREINKK